MAFTNFCIRSGGDRLNAGTRTGDTTVPGTAADFTYASGNWDSTTRTFTVASGNPSTDGVAAGDWVSIYANGSTATGYIARVTSVTSTTIVTDATALMGTPPASGTGTRTCKVGGAWPHMTTSTQFPFTIGSIATAKNSAGNPLRINIKNDATTQINSFASTNMSNGQIEGFSSSYGDGGRATFTMPSGTTQTLMSVSSGSTPFVVKNLILDGNNATSGTSAVVQLNGGAGVVFIGCVIRNARAIGFTAASGGTALLLGCEFYGNNRSNTANAPALNISTGTNVVVNQCIFHDNTGSNTDGILNAGTSGLVFIQNSIFDTNGRNGVRSTISSSVFIRGCDFYNNTSDGVFYQTAGNVLIVDSNFVLNGGWGINSNSNPQGCIINCAFGSGTKANTSGTIASTVTLQEMGTVTLPSDTEPWVDAANGDFRPAIASVKGTGYGTWTQTASSYSGTVSYPDIGAAQHIDTPPIITTKRFVR